MTADVLVGVMGCPRGSPSAGPLYPNFRTLLGKGHGLGKAARRGDRYDRMYASGGGGRQQHQPFRLCSWWARILPKAELLDRRFDLGARLHDDRSKFVRSRRFWSRAGELGGGLVVG
jgi:hypothetical protein